MHLTLLYGLQCFVQMFWFHMMILLQNMCQRLKKIHKKHVARELVIRAIENTQNKDQGEEDVELFCCCQTPPYDDSKPYFGCDDVH